MPESQLLVNHLDSRQSTDWYDVLAMAFADDSRFSVSPQSAPSQSPLQVYFTNQQNELDLILLVLPHPLDVFQFPSKRHHADLQMRDVLSDHFSLVKLPTFHAINVCGPKMSFYMVDCPSGRIFPRRTGVDMIDHVLPTHHLKNLWASELGTPAGDETLFSLISKIRSMLMDSLKLRPVIPSAPSRAVSSSMPCQRLTNQTPRPTSSLTSQLSSATYKPRLTVRCDGCSQIITGFRAKCFHPDCPDYDLCSKCYSRRFNFHPIDHFFKNSDTILDAAATTRPIGLTGSIQHTRSPDSIHNADCDICAKHIRGVRWKCLDCVDWDCCEECWENVQAIHPFHRLVPITDPSLLPAVLPAQHLKRHCGIICDACHQPVCGIRYKCSHSSCQNYNLCSRCESSPIPKHDIDHVMLKIRDSHTWQSYTPALESLTSKQSHSVVDLTASAQVLPETSSTPLPRDHESYQVPDIEGASKNARPTDSSRSSIALEVSSESNSNLKDLVISPADQETSTGPLSRSTCPLDSFPARSVGSCLLSSLEQDVNIFSAPSKDSIMEIGKNCEPTRDSSSLSDVNALAGPKLSAAESSTTALPGAFPQETSDAAFVDVCQPSVMDPSILPSSAPESHWGQAQNTSIQESDGDQSSSQYGASFVSDVTLPDDTFVSAGAHLTKVWLVRNTGSKQWSSGTQITLNGGFQHSCQDSFPVPPALPNEVVEVSIQTMAPGEPGGYLQVWRFVRPDGNKFGDRLWISLQAVTDELVNNDGPNSSSVSASASLLLPSLNMLNHRSEQVLSFEDSNSTSDPSHHDRSDVMSLTSQNRHQDDLTDNNHRANQSPSLSSTDSDSLSYQFTSEPNSSDNGTEGFELVTDSDSLSE